MREAQDRLRGSVSPLYFGVRVHRSGWTCYVGGDHSYTLGSMLGEGFNANGSLTKIAGETHRKCPHLLSHDD